ncbi:MAG: transporter substrate-binding domain-containing protein [Planctomycetota bacterium]|nr:transporter substrate-binding domain-containing protein [Planctomycetota bacterium]
MSRFLIVLLPLFALILSGCGGNSRSTADSDTLKAVKQRGEVRIGVKEDTKPFGFRLGGERAGFDIDIAIAIAQQLGIAQVRFVTVTSANRIDMLKSGDVDMVLASMTITRQRDREVDFSIPYFQDGQGLLVQKDSDIGSYLDLAGRMVGAVKGSTSGSNIAQVAPDASVIEFGDYQRLERALRAGTVDAITTDTVILLGMAQSSKGALRLAGQSFTVEPYGVAIVENQSNWRDAINEAIQVLWESGQYQMIYDTWFGAHSVYGEHVNFAVTTYPR